LSLDNLNYEPQNDVVGQFVWGNTPQKLASTLRLEMQATRLCLTQSKYQRLRLLVAHSPQKLVSSLRLEMQATRLCLTQSKYQRLRLLVAHSLAEPGNEELRGVTSHLFANNIINSEAV
jgi:hypothetical protein